MSVSPYKTAPTERLIVELFKLYREQAPKKETIDNFYFWGEMLLNDFDDVDKYLVDPKALFTNLADLHDIDEKFGGLTEEQICVIRRFIDNFRMGETTDQKRDFEFNWSLLLPLYLSFKKRLRELGIAYEGMAERDLLEEDKEVFLKFQNFEKYHFIGFNALNNCEKKLMRMLKTESKAEFYWDYQKIPFFEYNPKAAFFIEPNIMEFGQTLPSVASEKDNIPAITIVDIPSDSGQAKLLPNIFKGMGIENDPRNLHKTAVVLADENLLPALLSSIPPEIADINITMGYPFKMTVVYSLLKTLLSLQERRTVKEPHKIFFGHREVLKILLNPLVVGSTNGNARNLAKQIISGNMSFISPSFFSGDDFLGPIFKVVGDTNELCGYLRDLFMSIAETQDGSDPLVPEFLFRANQILNRLEPLFDDSSVNINKEIAIRLIDRIIREIKVPFRGEPLKGLQIMGILESRAIDFDNLVILSANEGVLPQSSPSPSYIPYNLREVFGLPVISHQDSIYDYYFTRLLTRAKNVVLVYNSSTEGMRSGEMSRFLLRLKYGNLVNPSFSSAKIGISGGMGVGASIPRTSNDIGILEKKYIKGSDKQPLSPSAINTWLNCGARFYYSYVCGMKEADTLVEGIDPARMGTMLHEVINRYYTSYIGEEMSVHIIEELLKNKKEKKRLIDEVLCEVWFGGDKNAPKTGNALILAEITEMFVDRVLEIDKSFAPFTLIGLEQNFEKSLPITYSEHEESIIIGGKIDRIDQREGVKRLIDYKTGKSELNISSIEELFLNSSKKKNDAVTQTLIYCYLLSAEKGFSLSRPVIYALRGNKREEWDDRISINKKPLDNFKEVEPQFVSLLKKTVEEIFDPSTPFTLTTDNLRCSNCPYKKICKK
jgi:CRISPR/Cas system-associated exonuclease Cas4 (RecB family)